MAFLRSLEEVMNGSLTSVSQVRLPGRGGGEGVVRSGEYGEAMTGSVSTPAEDAFCSIERTAAIIGDRWSFLILRQALIEGVTRFADLQTSLGIAPNVLTNRLGVLVDAGVLVKREYKEPGARPR